MINRVSQEVCNRCGAKVLVVGKGKWKKDIKAWEWYETDHVCPKLKDDNVNILSTKLFGNK